MVLSLRTSRRRHIIGLTRRRRDMELIRQRLREAERIAEEGTT